MLLLFPCDPRLPRMLVRSAQLPPPIKLVGGSVFGEAGRRLIGRQRHAGQCIGAASSCPGLQQLTAAHSRLRTHWQLPRMLCLPLTTATPCCHDPQPAPGAQGGGQPGGAVGAHAGVGARGGVGVVPHVPPGSGGRPGRAGALPHLCPCEPRLFAAPPLCVPAQNDVCSMHTAFYGSCLPAALSGLPAPLHPAPPPRVLTLKGTEM